MATTVASTILSLSSILWVLMYSTSVSISPNWIWTWIATHARTKPIPYINRGRNDRLFSVQHFLFYICLCEFVLESQKSDNSMSECFYILGVLSQDQVDQMTIQELVPWWPGTPHGPGDQSGPGALVTSQDQVTWWPGDQVDNVDQVTKCPREKVFFTSSQVRERLE